MKDLNKIIDKFSNTSIAVIGDICLDMYYFLTNEKSEISVETGIETRTVSAFKNEAGGAGNVAINLKTLGKCSVDIYGMIGEDSFGVTLRSILEKAGINCRFIQTQKSDWHTHVYHKVYKDGREEPRYDIGNFNKADSQAVKTILTDLESNIDKYQAVIINEQIIHGYHNEVFQSGLSRLIEKYEDRCLWITDCRHLNNIYNKSIRKLNNHEARALFRELHPESTDLPEDRALALWLHSYWGKPLIVTLGEEGAIAVDQNGQILETAGINLIGAKDTVGAGDAFLSGLTLTLASGGTLEEALHIGNSSASVSVSKLFETGHPAVEEVLEMGSSPDYRYNPDLAKDDRKARFLENSPVELINISQTNRPKVVIFDHDGTISTLRQGWEPIMKEVLIQAVLGQSFETIDPDKLKDIQKEADELIEKTTGVQTIIQMHALRDMVRSFGYVAEEEILSPLEYKKIYNDKLMKMVSSRVDLFQRGLLNLDDVTIKGAVPFLEKLRKAGVTIYMASGTDQEDVRREATLLGYADYFNGGIFGSVGDVNCDPKRMVIETIIKNIPAGIKPEDCYIFGDGPVEMREASKRGFTRIGLVSDEKQRFGTNRDKRPRLILGGAQALIPDFSWISILSRFLSWEV
ncbi:MAG: carbohydrate kinase [Spirochaetaceae bacterium 4572_59]|nr:MAG: carbohydrate kinase [Spirochaetaceae bacterium 4572_59]